MLTFFFKPSQHQLKLTDNLKKKIKEKNTNQHTNNIGVTTDQRESLDVLTDDLVLKNNQLDSCIIISSSKTIPSNDGQMF